MWCLMDWRFIVKFIQDVRKKQLSCQKCGLEECSVELFSVNLGNSKNSQNEWIPHN